MNRVRYNELCARALGWLPAPDLEGGYCVNNNNNNEIDQRVPDEMEFDSSIHWAIDFINEPRVYANLSTSAKERIRAIPGMSPDEKADAFHKLEDELTHLAEEFAPVNPTPVGSTLIEAQATPNREEAMLKRANDLLQEALHVLQRVPDKALDAIRFGTVLRDEILLYLRDEAGVDPNQMYLVRGEQSKNVVAGCMNLYHVRELIISRSHALEYGGVISTADKTMNLEAVRFLPQIKNHTFKDATERLEVIPHPESYVPSKIYTV